jgi:hypothetical protein
MRRLSYILPCVLALLVAGPVCGRAIEPPPSPPFSLIEPAFDGMWVLDEDRSTAIDPWRRLRVEIDTDGEGVMLKRMWRGSREGGAFVDSVRLMPGSTVESAPMAQWPDNRHLGAYIAGDHRKTVASRWEDDGRTLITESTLTVSTQQGERPIRIYTEYRLSPGGDRLDVLELRSTRPRPVHYVFTRAATQS